MIGELAARFEKRFRGGAEVVMELTQPANAFSVTVLFGPSGCGKTTTLRCLAGLERPDEGSIQFGSQTWFDADRRICLPPQARDVGYLFQDYALFPHLTVAGNIAFGLRDLPRTERRRRVGELLDLLGIPGLEERYPAQLSGGQQQRVALARAVARRPRLLLLDEPLSALDAVTREQLRPELRRHLAAVGVPVVLVTHDRTEAMALADHLVVLDAGHVLQQGDVPEVFTRPADLRVARSAGVETVQPGRVLRTVDGLAIVAVGDAELLAVGPPGIGSDVYVCIRGEDVTLIREAMPQTSARNRLPGRVTLISPEGALVRIGLDVGFPLTALVTRPAAEELCLTVGATLIALVKAPAVHLIPHQTLSGL